MTNKKLLISLLSKADKCKKCFVMRWLDKCKKIKSCNNRASMDCFSICSSCLMKRGGGEGGGGERRGGSWG